MHSEQRINILEQTLAASMSGNKPTKGYRQRVTAILAELEVLKGGYGRKAIAATKPAAPNPDPKGTTVQRMAAQVSGPRVVYKRAK